MGTVINVLSRIVNEDALKKMFGNEYPAAVVVHGIRLPLRRERRFSRSYHSDEQKMGSEVSRFMDGSACITASELQREWHTWTDDQRMDFCESCCWLDGQPDFPDMLRFILQHASPSEWSSVALQVGSCLPCNEAFDILLRALRSTDIGHTANLTQAIAKTKHRDAQTTLRIHLQAVWAHAALWDGTDFINWVAFDATTCIAHLIELGANPADFEEHVRQLSTHVCSHNRDACCNFLSKHYGGLR